MLTEKSTAFLCRLVSNFKIFMIPNVIDYIFGAKTKSF